MAKNVRRNGRNVVRLTANELQQGGQDAQRRAFQLHDDVETVEGQVHDAKLEAQQAHRTAISLHQRVSQARKRAQAALKKERT